MPTKWDELNETIGRELMTKRRSAQAVGAWSRHQGAHCPGTKKPDIEDIEEQLEELDECKSVDDYPFMDKDAEDDGWFEGTSAQHHHDFMEELAKARDEEDTDDDE